MREIEHTLTTEQLQALFEGKKLVLNYGDLPRVTLYPPNYGVFMTFAKFAELRRKIGFQAITDTDGFFLEILGEEMFEKTFGKKRPHIK